MRNSTGIDHNLVCAILLWLLIFAPTNRLKMIQKKKEINRQRVDSERKEFHVHDKDEPVRDLVADADADPDLLNI